DDVEAWDVWVRQVGRAFEEAGDGELVLPPSLAGAAILLVGRFPGQVGTGEAAVLTTRGVVGATTGTATTDASASSGLIGTSGGGSGRVAIDASAATTVSPPDEEPDLAVDDDFLAPLDGFWSRSDAAGELDLRGDGDEVRALRGEGWVCLPGGPAPVSGAPSEAGAPVSNRLFTATRQGSDLVGEEEVGWPDGHARHEWAPAPLHLTLTPDGEQLTGTWQDRARVTAVAITLSRADVEPLAPEDLSLPPTNLAIRGYGVLAARRADG